MIGERYGANIDTAATGEDEAIVGRADQREITVTGRSLICGENKRRARDGPTPWTGAQRGFYGSEPRDRQRNGGQVPWGPPTGWRRDIAAVVGWEDGPVPGWVALSDDQASIQSPRIHPRNTAYSANDWLMLGQRRRRLPNINPALAECIVFAG